MAVPDRNTQMHDFNEFTETVDGLELEEFQRVMDTLARPGRCDELSANQRPMIAAMLVLSAELRMTRRQIRGDLDRLNEKSAEILDQVTVLKDHAADILDNLPE